MLTVGESGGRWLESDPESDPEKLISTECKERWNDWNCVFMFVELKELPSGQDYPVFVLLERKLEFFIVSCLKNVHIISEWGLCAGAELPELAQRNVIVEQRQFSKY